MGKHVFVWIMAAATGLSAGAADAEIRKFDFGRKDRKRVMEGFTPVTVYDDYSDANGFGWLAVTGPVEAGWLEERAPLAGCCRRTGDERGAIDDLAADYVAGGGRFAVKLPDGKYVVWLMVGDWGAYEFYPRGKYTVLAQGRQIGQLDHATCAKFQAEFWRHRDEPYRHGADLFEKYVQSRFRTCQAEVDVTGGRLELQVRKDSGPGSYVGPLNAVVVYPLAEKAAGDAALKEIQAARKAWFQQRYPVIDPYEYYVGDFAKADNERGFATWGVAYGSDIGLGARRGRRTEGRELSAMVSLGEMEPVVLVVRPLKKGPGRFTCSVGPLRGDRGDVLAPEAVSVRAVKPWEMQVRATDELVDRAAKQKVKVRRGGRAVVATPYFLMERNWLEGRERLNRAFWLTVKMPPSAASGVYKADVTVSGLGRASVLPLTVTVLPFKLARAKQAVSVNYSAPEYPRWFDDSKGRFWDVVEKDLRLQHDYGMTTVALLGGFGLPRERGEENMWEEFIRLYRKVGFERELVQGSTMNLYQKMPKNLGTPWDKPWQDAFVKIFGDYDAVARRLGQKVIYSIGDETTNDGGEARIIHVGRIVKQRLGDLRLMSDINGYRELMGLAPNLAACGFNNGWQGSYATNRREHSLMTRDIIERVRALGSEPWFINGGTGRYPFGIWFWKTTRWGQKGKIEWHYDASGADSYNPFDGTAENDFGSFVLPDQVCTIKWELSREGIDDLRYLQRLEGLIAAHKDTQDAFLAGVLARASYVRDFWHDCVADRFTSTGNGDGSGDYAGDAWPPERLNRMRGEVAKMICMFEGHIVPGVYDDVAICDGDSGDRPDRHLGGRVTQWVKDPEHATQGEHCFKLTFKDGQGYADQWGRAPEKDWRGYRSLALDVVNPQQRAVTLVLNLRDQLASNLGNVELRNIRKLACRPGKNSFRIGLVGMKSSGADHVLDMGMLFSFFFTADGERQDVTLYVDDMRLCPK